MLKERQSDFIVLWAFSPDTMIAHAFVYGVCVFGQRRIANKRHGTEKNDAEMKTACFLCQWGGLYIAAKSAATPNLPYCLYHRTHETS